MFEHEYVVLISLTSTMRETNWSFDTLGKVSKILYTLVHNLLLTTTDYYIKVCEYSDIIHHFQVFLRPRTPRNHHPETFLKVHTKMISFVLNEDLFHENCNKMSTQICSLKMWCDALNNEAAIPEKVLSNATRTAKNCSTCWFEDN